MDIEDCNKPSASFETDSPSNVLLNHTITIPVEGYAQETPLVVGNQIKGVLVAAQTQSG